MSGPKLTSEYPSNLDDDQLIETIRLCIHETTRMSRYDNVVKGANYWKDVADIGLSELNSRIQKKHLEQITALNTELQILRGENKKSGFQNLIMAILTIILACVSIYLSYITIDESKQKEELILRNKQIENLNSNTKALKLIQLEIESQNSRLKNLESKNKSK